jgi:cytochrome c peroxidase
MQKIYKALLFASGLLVQIIRSASKLSRAFRKSTAIAVLVVFVVLAGRTVSAQLATPATSRPLASLKTVPIPEPASLAEFVSNKTAAIVLGKSLFWDMQVGSDGNMSCATCHFHAGTDARSKNQINPGLLRVNADRTPNPDNIFNLGGGPNYTLKPEDFPFHKLANPDNRSSTVLSDVNDVAGSQGVTLSNFNSTTPGNPVDNVTVVPDPVFNVGGTNVRQVTGRNAPSAINAVFNFRNFWNGRAQNIFNGVNPFGLRDPNAFLFKATTKESPLQKVKISINNASLASQAVGPPISSIEESATGRTFPDLSQKFDQVITKRSVLRRVGQKLRGLRPLGKQLVDPTDSVLGSLSASPRPGLNMVRNYDLLIENAFKREWWDSQQIIQVAADGTRTVRQPSPEPLADNEFTLMDYNFSLFMGLAIQLYESTLVSDNAPIDQFLEGNNNALTAQQKQGKEIFQGKAKCINCHGGAEFTNASVRNVQNQRLERMKMGNGGVAVYDNGFYNIGVRPTVEDLGVGGTDPFGNPLSESRLAQKGQFIDPNLRPRVTPNERVAVDGALKAPGLRNVELTAPYFHNGGQLTLRQVVEFYNRGGDFHERNIANLDPDIQNLGLTNEEKDALVAFLQSLTDERVRNESAPFDHPQLFIPSGHPGNQNSVTNDGTGQATDKLVEIPAVGRNGGNPLPNFLASPTSAAAMVTLTSD